MIVEGSGKILVDGSNPNNNFKALSELDDSYFGVIESTSSGVIGVEIGGIEYLANVFESPSLGWKFIGFKQKGEIFSAADDVALATVLVGGVLVVIFMLAGIGMARLVVDPINLVKDGLRRIAEGEGDLTNRIRQSSKDETGELARWFNQFIESTAAMISKIKVNTDEINRVSGLTADSSGSVSMAANEQHSSVDQVATAVTQMASAANEVAKNCVETANISEQGLEATRQGKNIIKNSMESVEKLGSSVNESNLVIKELEQETENINSILGTIQQIAEQTNLLALNAAIEAARAGEQGRGFAVVADEVRNLASRTQDSTEEINSILSSLNNRTQEVSDNMVESMEQSRAAIENSEEVSSAFEDIERVVKEIRDMTTQNASAAEEQHLVTEDINSNVIAINEAATVVLKLSKEVEDYSIEQAKLGEELGDLVRRFKT
jgi:methyl-accepting chemotaxis protein